MAKRGRNRLMLIGVSASLTYQAHVPNGFQRAVSRHDLNVVEPPEPLYLDMPLARLREIITDLYTTGNGPDGVVCVGDTATLAIMVGIHDACLVAGADADINSKQTSTALDHVVLAIDSYFEDIALTGRRLGETPLNVISGQVPLNQLDTLFLPEPCLWID